VPRRPTATPFRATPDEGGRRTGAAGSRLSLAGEVPEPAPARTGWIDRARISRLARDGGPLIAELAVPFVLVLYLALESGGYSTVTSSEVGVIAWWLVLLGAALGLLARGPIGRARWLAFGLLAAFAGWTALGLTWTESSEQTMVEVARVLTYLGVLALALSAPRPGAIGRVAAGVGAAIGVVAVLALLSRLQPTWFPENSAADFLPPTAERLSYPLGYWNGLAALLAMGMPLALVGATYSRRVLTSALAAAVVPVIALAAFYTLSRGGALEIAVGLVVLVALAPRRLALVPTLAITGGASALLVLIATRRNELEAGLLSETAAQQGDEMLLITLIVCVAAGAAVGLLQAAIRSARPEAGRWSARRRRAGGAIAVTLVAAALVAAFAAGAPGEVSDAWEEFKTPHAGDDATRFGSASGSGRYQNWSAALDANQSEPLTGIGPGAYEFWWSRTNDLPDLFVRDAHSLYLETLAEAGVVGLAILVALLCTVGWAAVSASRRGGRHAAAIAGASAACAAFVCAAAIDWAWELAALTVAFLLLAGALLAARERVGEAGARPRGGGRAGRAVLGVSAVIALVAIAYPLYAQKAIAESERAVAAGDLDEALERAESAAELQPYAATPSVQRAIVLEMLGEIDAAAAQAREATRQESTNWQTWLVLSRLEASRGNPREALDAYRTARSLNPQSPLFER
jgi:hypothetical protein